MSHSYQNVPSNTLFLSHIDNIQTVSSLTLDLLSKIIHLQLTTFNSQMGRLNRPDLVSFGQFNLFSFEQGWTEEFLCDTMDLNAKIGDALSEARSKLIDLYSFQNIFKSASPVTNVDKLEIPKLNKVSQESKPPKQSNSTIKKSPTKVKSLTVGDDDQAQLTQQPKQGKFPFPTSNLARKSRTKV